MPRLFLGCLISSLLAGLFMTRIDQKMVLYLGIMFALYGGSMVLYVLKPGGDKKMTGLSRMYARSSDLELLLQFSRD